MPGERAAPAPPAKPRTAREPRAAPPARRAKPSSTDPWWPAARAAQGSCPVPHRPAAAPVCRRPGLQLSNLGRHVYPVLLSHAPDLGAGREGARCCVALALIQWPRLPRRARAPQATASEPAHVQEATDPSPRARRAAHLVDPVVQLHQRLLEVEDRDIGRLLLHRPKLSEKGLNPLPPPALAHLPRRVGGKGLLCAGGSEGVVPRPCRASHASLEGHRPQIPGCGAPWVVGRREKLGSDPCPHVAARSPGERRNGHADATHVHARVG